MGTDASKRNNSRFASALIHLLFLLAYCVGGSAATHTSFFHVEAGDASLMLNEFSRQSDLQVLFDYNILRGIKTQAVSGDLDSSTALKQMLKGTNLMFEFVNARTLAVTPKRPSLLQRLWHRLNTERNRPRDSLEEVTIKGNQNREFTQTSVGSRLSTLNRSDIDSTGLTNIPDLLRTLPQTFGGGPTDHTVLGREAGTNSTFGTGFNLRGLDAGATLVLLDGRRLAGSGTAAEYTDITSIPLSVIDHIDILADGSSTRYGADAVAGVVNFVTRKNFRGVEIQAGAGQASAGALGQRGISQLWGGEWNSGRGMFAFELDQRDTLTAALRAQATNYLVPLGGDDFRQPYGSPGTIVVGSQTWAIPRNGPLVVSALQPGTQNLYDQLEGTDVLPSQKRFSFTTDIRQSVGEQADIWFASWLSTRESMEIIASGVPYTLIVPASNPFYVNPAGGTDPVEVLYGFGHDFGPLTTRLGVSSGSTALGAHFDADGWHVTGSLEYAFERVRQFEENDLNFNGLNMALSSSNPLTAFNPFVSGSSMMSPGILQELRSTLIYRSLSDVRTLSVGANRSLLRSPGGPLEIGMGVAFRHESFLETYSPGSAFVPKVQYARNVGAAFANFKVPFIGEGNRRTWIQRLEASFGARYESYRSLGGALVPKFGLMWSPITQAEFRGTWGRSIRPPPMSDIDESQNQSELVVLPDPRSPSGATALLRGGGNSDLRLEHSTTWTVGADVKPASGLTISITYFDIVDRGRIDQQYLTQDVLTNPAFLGGIIRDPTVAQRQTVCKQSTFLGNPSDCLGPPIDVIVDLRVHNLDTLATRGFDFSGRYQLGGTLGQFNLGADATYLLAFSQALRPGTSPLSLLNTQHNPIDCRARGTLSWKRVPVIASAFVNFTDSYRDTASTPMRKVDSWTTVDFSVQYEPGVLGPSWLRGTTLAINAQNVLNARAPFLNNGAAGLGYDQENANLTGRVVGFRIRHRW